MKRILLNLISWAALLPAPAWGALLMSAYLLYLLAGQVREVLP